MSKETGENTLQPPKSHLNQNLVIAIIGAIATLTAAILPWALDRIAEGKASPTPVPVTSTVAPIEFTATNTTAAASSTPTLEPPTQTPAPTEETGIYNAYLAFDFEGKLVDTKFKGGQPIYLFFDLNDPQNKNIVRVIVSVVDAPGFLVDSQFYNIINEYTAQKVRLIISQGGLSPGKYKVEMILNNTLDESLEFEVTK